MLLSKLIMINQLEKKALALISLNLKERFLKMYFQVNAGHVGSSLSCLELLTYTYFQWMNKADELILSKGHAAASLYSLLAEDGILMEEDISTFYKDGTLLAAHPPANKIPKIPFATGSLGHGLGLSAGMALASILNQQNKNTACLKHASCAIILTNFQKSFLSLSVRVCQPI